jgi:hypothetical protein
MSLTLSGDASGSATFTNMGNATLSVTVADDSHNHTIANVDGLQSALDGKLSTSGKAADANLLDGINSTSFLRSDTSDNFTTLTGTTLNATTVNSTSDERLKENVETIADASTKVAALRGVNFDWKATGEKSMGVIAQEVEAVIPEVVATDEEGGKAVNYQAMVGLLIEAVKELQEEVKALKS